MFECFRFYSNLHLTLKTEICTTLVLTTLRPHQVLYFAHDLNTTSGIFLLAKADIALATTTLFNSNLHVLSDLPSL